MADVEKVARAMWEAIEARRHAPFGPKYKDYDDLAAQAAAKPYDWAWQEMQGLTAMAEAALAAMGEQEAVAWVIPGDDNARDGGFIDAKCYRDGEFTQPLYASPRPEAVGEAKPRPHGEDQ